jgi:hypothetical protein
MSWQIHVEPVIENGPGDCGRRVNDTRLEDPTLKQSANGV